MLLMRNWMTTPQSRRIRLRRGDNKFSLLYSTSERDKSNVDSRDGQFERFVFLRGLR